MPNLATLQVPRRPYREGVGLSIIGLGGMAVLGLEQRKVDRLVAESIDAGVNFIDVAPAYGDGEAESKLGIALGPCRNEIFLAGKTLERSAPEALADLEGSLRRLRTDRLDLYQCHAVHTAADVSNLLSPGGAIGAMVQARDEGKVRFLGFTAHTAEAALLLLDGFSFDSVSLPVNFVCNSKRDNWREVLAHAIERKVARIALKAMALTHWRKGEARTYPHCWYKPVDDQELARLALRFSLSEDVTTVLPPGDERLYRLALELAPDLPPVSSKDRTHLAAIAKNLKPVLG